MFDGQWKWKEDTTHLMSTLFNSRKRIWIALGKLIVFFRPFDVLIIWYLGMERKTITKWAKNFFLSPHTVSKFSHFFASTGMDRSWNIFFHFSMRSILFNGTVYHFWLDLRFYWFIMFINDNDSYGHGKQCNQLNQF